MECYDNLVNYDFEEPNIINEIKPKYNNRTEQYYKILRLRIMDPIITVELDNDKCFMFFDKWDPYTGERLGKDEDGPLCFHPDILIHYYYLNRLNNLWVEPLNDSNNEFHYQGYYDAAVGAGEDIFIQSRGYYPDKYLFRLPIIDCYLTCDHSESIITMCPKLTDDEVKKIDELANLYGNNYENMFGKKRPSLLLMKNLYDQAISKDPYIGEIDKSKYNKEQIEQLKNNVNRCAVDKLKKLK